MLALHVQGDTMAPRSSTEALLRKVKQAKVQWVNVMPPAQPLKMNPHFRWLKDPSPAVREKLVAQGMEVTESTPEDFARYIREEIAKWAKVVKASGARAD